MLTNTWKTLSELPEYTFVQLDDMWQRGEIECLFEQLRTESGISRGTIHHYRLLTKRAPDASPRGEGKSDELPGSRR